MRLCYPFSIWSTSLALGQWFHGFLVFLQGTERPPVLLVDGYNVLHMYVQHMQDSHSDSAMAAAQAFEDSRIGLESAMITYSQSRRIKVVIVYDAINRLPDPVYVDIRTSTRLEHSAFNLLSPSVQYPDVTLCSLWTISLQNQYQRFQDMPMRHRVKDASGDTAHFTIVTVIPAQKGSSS